MECPFFCVDADIIRTDKIVQMVAIYARVAFRTN